MWVTKECLNPDCKEFGRPLIHHTSFQVHNTSNFCSFCLIGKVNIRFEKHPSDDSFATAVDESEANMEVTAQFHLDKIFRK